MIIKEISAKSERALEKAFGEVLLDKGIGYKQIGVFEKDGKVHAFFETPDEKGYTFEWESKLSIGHEPQFIVKEVSTPFFQRREQPKNEGQS